MMISAFQNRELGFGFDNFESIKNKVNDYRLGKEYIDKESAIAVYNTAEKQPLTVDPFVKYFEYGNSVNKSGYWTYEHIICQLEDVIDILYIHFDQEFDILFLFDHLCGHDRS